MAGEGRSPTGHRVVMFPFPSPSHITPMLQLAGLLRARGLDVTVLHADFNAPDPARHPEFTFVSIRENLPREVVYNADMVEQMIGFNAACEAPFQAALEALLLQEDEPRVCAVVVDGQWYAMLGAAKRAGVPALAMRADGAATFLSMLATPRLRADGYVPIEGERLDEPVPGLDPLRVRDLIRVDVSHEETVLRFITLVADAMRASSSGVIVNTFDAIEGPELAKIRAELSRPAFAVGPLHLLSPARVEHGLHAPDRGCLAWLDTHPPRSVLYVSLGSVARIDRAVFEEMARGLAGSGVPFLWVLRPGLLRGGADQAAAPSLEELDNAVGRNGKVVTWAPQREVLAHPSVGGFWTHCGWNSMMETICEGVPVLAQPCFADQTVSARYVTNRWGVGLDVGKVIQRENIANAISNLMAGEDVEARRERARHLKMEANRCAAEGGSASLAVDNLVEYLLSL
ncbi:hypothetical protein QOZ80_7BG0594830 [Eleusine coracana subsp. coracana]|nr:hypothetical protein QOZ80_7BG0594830 [Eleusine coracana subsp. coracana]